MDNLLPIFKVNGSNVYAATLTANWALWNNWSQKLQHRWVYNPGRMFQTWPCLTSTLFITPDIKYSTRKRTQSTFSWFSPLFIIDNNAQRESRHVKKVKRIKTRDISFLLKLSVVFSAWIASGYLFLFSNCTPHKFMSTLCHKEQTVISFFALFSVVVRWWNIWFWTSCNVRHF